MACASALRFLEPTQELVAATFSVQGLQLSFGKVRSRQDSGSDAAPRPSEREGGAAECDSLQHMNGPAPRLAQRSPARASKTRCLGLPPQFVPVLLHQPWLVTRFVKSEEDVSVVPSRSMTAQTWTPSGSSRSTAFPAVLTKWECPFVFERTLGIVLEPLQPRSLLRLTVPPDLVDAPERYPAFATHGEHVHHHRTPSLPQCR